MGGHPPMFADSFSVYDSSMMRIVPGGGDRCRASSKISGHDTEVTGKDDEMTLYSAVMVLRILQSNGLAPRF